MIKFVTQNSYFEKKPKKQMRRFQNNPSIGSVHPKSTHACPLAWDNKKEKPKLGSNQTIFQHGKSYKYCLFCRNYLTWNKLIFETKYEIHQAIP